MRLRAVLRASRQLVLVLSCAQVSCQTLSVPPHVAAVDEGEADLAVGDPASALGHFERALRLKPDSLAAQRGIALARLGLGQSREARTRFEELTRSELWPFHPDTMASACGSLWASLEAALAAGRLAEVIEVAETSPLAASCGGSRLAQLQQRAWLGEAARLRAVGDDGGSLEQLAVVLEHRPGDPAATLASVELLVQAHRRGEALWLLAEALARHPGDQNLIETAVDLLLIPNLGIR